MQTSLSIFISYAHEDESLLRELENHIAMLRNLGVITAWHSRNISAGTEWEREIDAYLNTAQIILLLISANFLASTYCYGVEMRRAMERHNTGEARVIPIILRPVDWKGAPFSGLQMLPRDGKAVTIWPNLDQAFVDITMEIRKAVEDLSIGRPESVSNLPSPALSQIIVPRRLPRPATLVGRDAEMTKLMARLRVGETSGIYALNGMGGVGKTALAAEIVGRFLQEREIFPGGAVWIFCEGLEGSSGLEEIWRQVALALQLEQVIKMTDPDVQRVVLSDILTRSRRFLLTLDNVEPNLDADILLDTLAIPDHTTVLLTARQALVTERLTTSIRLGPLLRFEAGQLFTQRLKRKDDSRPTNEDEKWIPQINGILGGLPLAIELVAAYAGVQSLPLTYIQWELEQDKLASAAFNFDPRRALRSRFDRSWAVLSSKEQELFSGLALLRGMAFPRESVVTLAEALDWKSEAEALNRTSELENRVIKFFRRILGKHVENLDRKKEPERSFPSRSFDTDSPFARQAVAKLVAYSLIEPVGQLYIRLHPLLREYAGEQFKRLAPDICERLQQRAKQVNANWQDYPIGYEGLTGSEADNVWELHREAHKARWKTLMEEQTTTSLPAASNLFITHAKELQKLGSYIGEAGEQNRARERILESLEYCKAAGDVEGITICYRSLASFDEREGNYTNAIEHYSRALRLLQQFQLPDTEQVHKQLKRLQTQAGQASVPLLRDSLRGLIRIQQGNEVGHTYKICSEPLRIGRSRESDIVLDEPSVSRKHAILLPLNESDCGLKDEDSTNGTRLNGQLINKQQIYTLRSGDTIHVGEIMLIFTTSDFQANAT